MFLQLAHTKLDVFEATKAFVLECYRVTQSFPPEEKFAMVSQIRRAALSTHLNVAEGCSRKSPQERKRFFEISRGSIIEVDTAMDVAVDLMYCTTIDVQVLGEKLIKTFKILCGLIGSEGAKLTTDNSPLTT
ncbi:MAG TPA: four helix bundle protein [Flavisolibacter sp.]|jgi:four helix bundle protein|nr:four helix bundle protein [Flavisolibacter sp.]